MGEIYLYLFRALSLTCLVDLSSGYQIATVVIEYLVRTVRPSVPRWSGRL